MEDVMMMQSTAGRAVETLFKGVNILGRVMMIVGLMFIFFYFLEKRKKSKWGIRLFFGGFMIRISSSLILFMKEIDLENSPRTDWSIWIVSMLIFIMLLNFSKKRDDKGKDPEPENIKIKEECLTTTDSTDSKDNSENK